MKLKSFLAVVTTGAIASFVTACTFTSEVSNSQTDSLQKVQTATSTGTEPAGTEPAEANEQEVQFICSEGYDPKSNERVPTTFAWTQRGKTVIVRWKYKWFNNSDYTTQRRCQEVSSRIQTAYNNDRLQYLANGTQNNQSVICTARQKGSACDTTLLTLRPNDDSLEVLSQLNDIFRGKGGAPIEHSSGKHQVYYKIDIEKFLQTAPIEEK